MTVVDESTYLLGSGDLFIGVVDPTASEDTIAASLTNVGMISGGASLTYKPSFVEVESSNRGVIASLKTKEDVTFKSGILTWDLENIEKLSAAYYSEDSEKGTRRVGIGGMKNVPINYLRFVHTKPDGLTLTVNVFKAQSNKGFELTFDKEKQTVVDAEFKALAVSGKNDGNLVEIIEQVGVQPAPTVSTINPTSIAETSEPALITITGTGFTQHSVVFIDNAVTPDVDLRTLYVSSTQLQAVIEGLSASLYSIKVKNGANISVGSKSLTIS